MGIVRLGGFGAPATNEDCYKCAKSFVETECTSEYEPEKWFSCNEGHVIDCQYDEDCKGCGLPKGSYYKVTYTIITDKK